MNSHDVFVNQRLLVRKILERPIGYDWTVQGLGMMRIYLSDEIRIHVWHSSLIVPGVTDVHDHPWDFESLVLAGELHNHTYFQSEEGKGSPYYQDLLLCGTGQLANDPSPVWLEPWRPDGRPQTYIPGDTYSQRYSEIHRSEFTDGTVTLVRRKFVNEDRDHAYVYWPRGGQFGSAEPRPAKVEEIRLVASSALEQLS